MAAPTTDISPELSCHICGYDLRAHPHDGKCPECATSITESRQFATVPCRPAWRDSDPRWRRRILAGTWVLVLLPLMDVVRASQWASTLPVPNVFNFPGSFRLDETLLCNLSAYESLGFCIGVVLLFSKERGRRHGKLDWTRRWGVICSYVVFLLFAAGVLFISALVLAGIGALLQSMPLKYQPHLTKFFVNVSTTYIKYGPYPKNGSDFVLVAFSSIAILLASVPLFDALRSTGLKRLAIFLLAPLALFSLMYLIQAAHYWISFSGMVTADIFNYEFYFRPALLVSGFTGLPIGLNLTGVQFAAFLIEVAKWSILLAIAVWLTIAQIMTWRQRKKTPPTAARQNF
jgi:hypothetical protein